MTLFLLACIDRGVKTYNTAPEVAFSNVSASLTPCEGVGFEVEATWDDAQDGYDIDVVWLLDGTEVVEGVTNDFVTGEGTLAFDGHLRHPAAPMSGGSSERDSRVGGYSDLLTRHTGAIV